MNYFFIKIGCILSLLFVILCNSYVYSQSVGKCYFSINDILSIKNNRNVEELVLPCADFDEIEERKQEDGSISRTRNFRINYNASYETGFYEDYLIISCGTDNRKLAFTTTDANLYLHYKSELMNYGYKSVGGAEDSNTYLNGSDFMILIQSKNANNNATYTISLF